MELQVLVECAAYIDVQIGVHAEFLDVEVVPVNTSCAQIEQEGVADAPPEEVAETIDRCPDLTTTGVDSGRLVFDGDGSIERHVTHQRRRAPFVCDWVEFLDHKSLVLLMGDPAP